MTSTEDELRMEINWEVVAKERAEELAAANKAIEMLLDALENTRIPIKVWAYREQVIAAVEKVRGK